MAAALVVVVGLLLVGVGDRRVRAVTSSERTSVDVEPRGIDHGGDIDLFDPAVLHEVSIAFEVAAYERMIEQFQNEDEKGWLSATVVIDGATVDNVGVRLKGNSSLFGLMVGPDTGPGADPCPPDGVVDEAAGTCRVEVPSGEVLVFDLDTGVGTMTFPDGTTAELLSVGPASQGRGPGRDPGGPPPCPPFAEVDEVAGTCTFDAPNGDHLVIDLETGAGAATRPDGTVVEILPRPSAPGRPDTGPSEGFGGVVADCPPFGEVDEEANTCTIAEPDGSVVVIDLVTGAASVTFPDGEVMQLPPLGEFGLIEGLGGSGFGGTAETPGEFGLIEGPGGPGFDANAETPELLPWLVKFDEFIDGQRYQGLEEVVVRSSFTATALNETLALGIVGLAGEPTQRSVHAALSVNGGDRVLRHVIEVPDDVWEERTFGSDGVLYKALTRGTWQYRGEDPLAYTDSFSQETRRNRQDLQPLIDFVRFLEEADDETFASALPARLDVGSFARYLALMDLLANFDDIDGPGNNAYLRFDLDTERFRILTWDLNLALQGGGGMGPGVAERPEGEPGVLDLGPVGGPGFGNPLVTRFRAVAAFADLVGEASTDLAADIYASGAYARILEERAEVLIAEAGDLVEPEVVRREVEVLHALIGQMGASDGG